MRYVVVVALMGEHANQMQTGQSENPPGQFQCRLSRQDAATALTCVDFDQDRQRSGFVSEGPRQLGRLCYVVHPCREG